MLENFKLSTKKHLILCGSCGKVCSKPPNKHFGAVENSTFAHGAFGGKLFEVYIIPQEGETAGNAEKQGFVSNFKNIDL